MTIGNTQLVGLLLGNAAMISVALYLIRFFGKILTLDNIRNDDAWLVEFSGLNFLRSNLVSPALLTALVIYVIKPNEHHWIFLIVQWLILAGVGLEGFARVKMNEKLRLALKPLLTRIGTYHETVGTMTKIEKGVSKVPISWFAFVCVYVTGVEIAKGGVIWGSIFVNQTFFTLVLLALLQALRKQPKLPTANIYFSGDEDLIRVELLKIFKDEVVVRKEGVEIILNRAFIKKIEIQPGSTGENGESGSETPGPKELARRYPLA